MRLLTRDDEAVILHINADILFLQARELYGSRDEVRVGRPVNVHLRLDAVRKLTLLWLAVTAPASRDIAPVQVASIVVVIEESLEVVEREEGLVEVDGHLGRRIERWRSFANMRALDRALC